MGNSKATTTSEDYCPTDSLTNQEGERERVLERGDGLDGVRGALNRFFLSLCSNMLHGPEKVA